VVPVNTKC